MGTIPDTVPLWNTAAVTYDRDFGPGPVARYLRAASLETLRRRFRPGMQVLEIGCGTGTEAVALARRGVRVTAVDLSPEMIARARAKAAAAGVAGRIAFRVLPAENLDELAPQIFDGAYSSFGALNVVGDLRAFAERLARRLAPGACFVSSVMNAFCAWEILYFLGRGRLREAVRRFGPQPRRVALGGGALTCTYYTPGAYFRRFHGGFDRLAVAALPVIVPPPYLEQHFTCRPPLLRWLRHWDRRLRFRFLFRAWGDHFQVVMRKKTLTGGVER